MEASNNSEEFTSRQNESWMPVPSAQARVATEALPRDALLQIIAQQRAELDQAARYGQEQQRNCRIVALQLAVQCTGDGMPRTAAVILDIATEFLAFMDRPFSRGQGDLYAKA